jgi:hypothetical protein
MSDYKISKQQGATGGAGESVDQTTTFQRKDGTYQTPGTVNGVQTLNGGTTTASSAPVLTSLGATNGGGGVQLADTTRDYMVYLGVTTAGTATTVEMGHSSAASDVVIVSNAAVSAGLISFRLPAGWYFKWAGTTTAIANQNAVGC